MAVTSSLISTELHEKLTNRIIRDHALPQALAERAVDEAIAFLVECADDPRPGRSPSAEADIGWHAFILHTREHADFCERIAGRFIHHEPTGEKCGITWEDGGPPCQNPPPS